jgi:hypothetical protein
MQDYTYLALFFVCVFLVFAYWITVKQRNRKAQQESALKLLTTVRDCLAELYEYDPHHTQLGAFKYAHYAVERGEYLLVWADSEVCAYSCGKLFFRAEFPEDIDSWKVETVKDFQLQTRLSWAGIENLTARLKQRLRPMQ